MRESRRESRTYTTRHDTTQERVHKSLLLLLLARTPEPHQRRATMNRNETTSLLRLRRELTGETFNDGTLDAWARACQTTDANDATHAMTEAARSGRVTLATFTERLPRRTVDDRPPVRCQLCGGSGWVSSPPERAHNPRVCHPTEERPCYCHAAEPCRCSAGRQAEDVRRRIIDWNDRHREPHLVDEPAAPWTLLPDHLDTIEIEWTPDEVDGGQQ